MFGRTLEAIVRGRGSAQAVKALERNLAAALEVMATEGALSTDLAEWAKELRLARTPEVTMNWSMMSLSRRLAA
jgi:hypothetical protein